MEVGAVKKQIKDKTLDKLYIFTGDEIEAQRIYVNKIAEVSGKLLERIDSVGAIYNSQRSLFSKPKCYVCRDDKDFMKVEKAWDTIESVLGDNMLILLITDLDKRTKFYKHFSDRVVEFNYMKRDTLKKYILRQVNLSDYWLDVLIDVCESDYSRILLEIDKMQNYADATSGAFSKVAKYDSILSKLLDDGTIYTPPQDAIFDFTDAVLFNNPKDAFRLLEDCKSIGEPSLRLVTVLYNNARKLLQVQSCQSKNVAKVTGLSGWDIKCVSNKVGCWDTVDLVYMLKLLRYVEKSIKTGTIEDAVAIDYVMVNLF